MRKIYLLLLGCLPLLLSAQPVLQGSLNGFRAGDVLYKQQMSYKDPGRAGANVLWDFSALEVDEAAYKLSYRSDNDTLFTGVEHLTRYRYTLLNDSLWAWGFDNQGTKLPDRRPELLLHFPVQYGDSVGSFYYAHGSYGNRLEVDAMGATHTLADAFGKMLLPNGDTLTNVLRTRTLKYLAETTRPIGPEYFAKQKNPLSISDDSIVSRLVNDSALFVTETFRWYARGYRYPVFETVRSWTQLRDSADYEFLATAFFYPPEEQALLDDPDNEALLAASALAADSIADPWAGLTYNLAPNPVRTSLLVEMDLPREVSHLRIQLRSSMGLILHEEDKGFYPVGSLSFPVSAASLPIGNYILDLWLDDHLISEIIMKR
jgi:hypothetical protein